MNITAIKNVKPLTIGQVASLSGVGVETVRFYERQGLISEPPRKESGYRQYPGDTVKRIKFIKSAKELGFTLKEILELLNLRVDPATSCSDVRKKAEAKLMDVDEKIAELKKIKKALKKLAVSCSGSGPVSHCPILEALDSRRSDDGTKL